MNIAPTELLVAAAMVALGLALGFQPPGEDTVARWLAAYEAPTDDISRSAARRFLARSKRWRFSGGFLAIVVYSLSTSDAPAWVNSVVVGLAGYLIGAIGAEVVRSRRPESERFAGAMVAPRTLTHYVHRTAIVGLIALPLAAIALASVFRSIEADVPRRFELEDPTAVMGAAGVALAVAVVVWIALRAIVQRPQPAGSTEEVMLDDAMRASGAHALAGAALALEWLLLTFLLSATQNGLSADGSRFADSVAFLSLVSLAAALASWAIIGHPGRWRPRRPVAAEGHG